VAVRRFIRRYITALLGLAAEQGLEERVLSDVRELELWLGRENELQRLILDPRASVSHKKATLEKALPSSLHDLTRNFVLLVVDRGRGEILAQAREEYEEQLRARQGVIRVEVTSATALGDDQKRSILEELSERTRKKVDLVCNVDERLLGGLRIRIGSSLYDGSLKRRLHELRNGMLAVAMPSPEQG